mmetsp:Transcript_11841/g.21676  ORF Transcript_11841/g.21676 Transcript_11841/m.21676 type:complete len:2327 (-) Transcript_11841:669-7649(-)
MGQLLGKARLREAAEPLVNLDGTSVYVLWESFNDVAEGFGINVEELTEIISALQNSVFAHAPKQVILVTVERMFEALDTDKNMLIDSLEALVTLCMLSGIELREKAKFCFMCYDFDESGQITMDEMTLLLKSCATGLCKLSQETQVPEEAKLEQLAQDAFKRTGSTDDIRITAEEFIDYCCSTPEIIAWCNFYDDSYDFNAKEMYDMVPGLNDDKKRSSVVTAFNANLPLDVVLQEESVVVPRPSNQRKARDPDCTKPRRPTRAEVEVERKIAYPWKETAAMTVPTDPPVDNPSQPDDSALKLDWVHGYSSQASRNNIRYNTSGELVYMAANVGIVYSPETHEQRFNVDHTDEILAIALHPDGDIVATGERGDPPKIHVWESSSTRVLVTLRGLHRVGVSSLAFSPGSGGRWLISVGQDFEHTIALYNWQKREMVFAAKSCRSRVLDAVFRFPTKESSTGVPPSFITCGEDHMYFWNLDNNRMKKKGVYGKIGAPQTMLCAVAHPQNNKVISGALSGHLYIWDANRNLQRTLKAHDCAVTSLFFHKSGLLSGGGDGKVRIWSNNLEQGATFDVAGLGSLSPGLVSVCYSDDGSKILCGTRGGEIFEMSSEDGSNLHAGPLIASHYTGELHGLAVHPHKAEYCTVGDDQTVRIWDVETKRMTRMVKLDTKARACAYSPDGTLIAVGLGGGNHVAGGKTNKKDGAFVILNEADLCIIHEARDSKKWIADLKFSPDGATMAIGSTDNAIYLYNVEDFASKGKCKGHHGSVQNLDFSEDNQCIQSNCTANELLFWNANTGEQWRKPSTMRDVEWAAQQVPVGYSVQGMWTAPGVVDVVSCERSKSGKVIVANDSAGRIRLYRTPVINPAPGFHQFRGHSSRVRRANFLFNDSYLITVGQMDRCAFQWRHECDESEELIDDTIYKNDPDSEDEDDFKDGTVLDRSLVRELANQNQDESVASRMLASGDAGTYDKNALEDEEYLDETDEELEKENKQDGEADAVVENLPERPWVRLAVPPSLPPTENHTATDEGLSLEWVHGYNSSTSRNTVKYLPNGEVIYPAANLGIVLNKQGGGLQRFFTNHNDHVICLALHPQGKLIATGQLGKNPKIVVWNSETMEAIQTLVGFHKRGVNALKFSRDGKQIVSVGLDDEHKVAVYDWANKIVTVNCAGGVDKVLDVDFNPAGDVLVQCGVNHIKFHDLEGRNVVTRRGILGKKGKRQAMYCIGWAGNRAVVGTADGYLYGFDGRVLQQAVKGHEGSVICLYSCSEGLASGGKDGRVKIWTHSLDIKAQFEIGGGISSVRSVCWDPEQNRILVGTRSCQILEISGTDGSNINGDLPLIQGHSKHELWGLAMHPTKLEYCTVGDDQTVRIWDIQSRKLLRSHKLDTMARTCVYSPCGSKIAIGLGARTARGRQKKDGAYLILNEKDLMMVHEGRNSKQWITDIKYSGDGATLALGSYDNSLYLYDVGGGYSVKGVFDGHNSFITHVDISVDGQYVHTNCGAHEIKYCDANSGTHIPAVSTLKDVQWDTWTCALGWPVKGVHNPGASTEIVSLHRSNNKNLVLTGDELGRLDLRRYPCISYSAGKKTYRGHTGAIQNCRFAYNDTYAITVGGEDRCVMQWKLEYAEEDVAIQAGDSGRDSDIVFETMAAGPTGMKGADDAEFVAVRPWISAVIPPTGAPTPQAKMAEPPENINVELEFVYGYRSGDVRNNLRYNSVGQMVYHTSSVGIIYDKAQHSQIFYLGHDGHPIISLAMDPGGKYVATGEGSCSNRKRDRGLVRVHIWNALTGAQIIKLAATHVSAASQLAFSGDGSRLVSVGEDENHSVAVWRSDSGTWVDAQLLALAMGGQEKIMGVIFHGPTHLATCGVNHITFWNLDGQVLTPTKGLFGRKGKVQPLLCAGVMSYANVATSVSKVVTGTVTGHLYIWAGAEVIKSIKGHERSVNAIHSCQFGIITGSKDGVVKLWDTKLSPIRTFDMTEAIPTPHRPPVRSVCWSPERATVLIGTQGSEIYEITTENQSTVLITQGHSMDELHSIATHPKDPNLFVTGGDDYTVRLWDASKRRMVLETMVGCMSRAVAWSPNGETIGVGLGGSVGRGRQTKDGGVLILDGTSLKLVHETRDAREWIVDAKYSPDGATLAIAAMDNKIYLYDVSKNYELRCKCEGHNSFVMHIDFSEDSEYIRSNCGGYDLLFHKCEDGTVINSPSMLKDVKFTTTTCTLCWHVQGMWPEVTDKTNYNACDVAEDIDLLASVDDEGYLNIFNYPCLTKGSVPLKYRAHVSQVTNVRFNSDRTRIFTTGGPDRAICQWKLTRKQKNIQDKLAAANDQQQEETKA